MKKLEILLAAAAALLACSVEPAAERNPLPEAGEICFEAGFDSESETRTVRQSDGKVHWLPGNELSLFRAAAGDGGNRFVTNITAPAASASFKGESLSGSGYYHALYPYDPASRFDGTSLHTTLPAVQEGVAGTFADNLFISAARTRTQAMSFKHVCGGVKFSVEDEDIRRVSLIAPGGEALAGDLSISFSTSKNPEVTAVSNPASILVMEPEDDAFEPGEAYHFVTVPATLSQGFSLVFERWDDAVAVKTVSSPVTINRAGFRTLMNADAGLEWVRDVLEFSPEEVNVTAYGGKFSIVVRSSGDYHVDVDPTCDWIVPVKVEGVPILGAKHTFKALRNTGEARMAVVTVCSTGDSGNCFPVLVFQEDGSDLKGIVHHSLGMRFTATWCGWCPYMNEAFHKAKEMLDDRFEVVNLHAGSSSLAFSATDVLADQYKVQGYPTGIVDGRIDIDNLEDTQLVAERVAAVVDETEANYPVVTAIGLSSTVSDGVAQVRAEVFATFPEDYILTVFLLESGVVATQTNNMPGGTTTGYVHDNIGRVAVTPALGQAFSTTVGSETKVFTFNDIAIPDGCNIANMSVLAYVQRKYGEQPVIRSADYGDWYIDNCRIVPLGTTAAPEITP